MYPLLLSLHNIIRWVVLIIGIVATVLAFMGWFGRREWTERDRRIGSFFGISLDIQFLIGLLLYFVYSPLTRTALSDFGAAMSAPDLRFIAVEHVFTMLAAIVLAHVGSVLARRAETSQAKFKRAAIFFGLALLLVLVGIPWSRPLFRLG